MLLFDALGTQIKVSGEGEAAAAQEIRCLGELLTRFKPSALTTLNTTGELANPPLDLVRAVSHALDVARRTGGLVTPAILPVLEAAGYAGRLGDHWGSAARVPDTSEIVCAPELLRLPAGTRLDLGGTAKSWIAQRAFTQLHGDGFIDAGGDMMLRQSGRFAVEIERPFGGPAMYLECPPGVWGVATSSTLKRAWTGGHHLIDPRTGRPLESGLVQVTVIARALTDAEVLTKLAFLEEGRLDQLQHQAQVYAFDRESQFLTRRGGRWQTARID
ncbi:FAD:protein FMN transferase [Deinococcus alpinitundrae]|uniref:FAD:protein FMN transferase n=1 Tax=Deinococcus alpinitundrae TaxID=468913 RepID=UPI00137AE7D6|nr:FAD:protein FMN transferase [Deinococcus alpinitundrae]